MCTYFAIYTLTQIVNDQLVVSCLLTAVVTIWDRRFPRRYCQHRIFISPLSHRQVRDEPRTVFVASVEHFAERDDATGLIVA
jgi:hypothetical protein